MNEMHKQIKKLGKDKLVELAQNVFDILYACSDGYDPNKECNGGDTVEALESAYLLTGGPAPKTFNVKVKQVGVKYGTVKVTAFDAKYAATRALTQIAEYGEDPFDGVDPEEEYPEVEDTNVVGAEETDAN